MSRTDYGIMGYFFCGLSSDKEVILLVSLIDGCADEYVVVGGETHERWEREEKKTEIVVNIICILDILVLFSLNLLFLWSCKYTCKLSCESLEEVDLAQKRYVKKDTAGVSLWVITIFRGITSLSLVIWEEIKSFKILFTVIFSQLMKTTEDDWRAKTQRLFNFSNCLSLMEKECYILLNCIMIKRSWSLLSMNLKANNFHKKRTMYLTRQVITLWCYYLPCLRLEKYLIITPLDQKIILVIHFKWINLFLNRFQWIFGLTFMNFAD